MKQIFKLCRFSNFQEKLNRSRLKMNNTNNSNNANSANTKDHVQDNSPNNDLNEIVRNNGSSMIYKHQPDNDTVNMHDISPFSPMFQSSRKDEKLRFKISGEESQIAIVDIYPGETVRSESDKIIFMTEGVSMETHTGGGVGSMFGRLMGGSSLFVTDYTYEESQGYGRVAFAETFPAKIIPIRLDDYGGQINCKKGSYICGTTQVDINIMFSKKISTGFFGGEGFILQSLVQQTQGQTVLLRAGGSIIKRTLRDGEKLRVAPGLVVAFQNSVEYSMEMISLKKGYLNIFGGSRSLFQATFTGPGDLYLQSLSFERLVEEISDRIPSRGGGFKLPFGGGGSSDTKDDTNDDDED